MVPFVGIPYFVDHNSRTTTFIDPRTNKSTLFGQENLLQQPKNITYERHFSWKENQFRLLCASNSLPSTFKITVSRQNVLESSMRQILAVKPYQLRRRLHVSFEGEEGIDYGGVAREWFFKLSREVLNPMWCLFQYANDTNYALQINPHSSINPDHLKYFRFIGRFIALALFQKKFIDSGFTLPFYKRILNRPMALSDLEAVDPEYYRSLKWIQETDLSEYSAEDLGFTFSIDHEAFGKLVTNELKPNGNEIFVSEENKSEYIKLMLNWILARGVEDQTGCFLHGFNEVVPVSWLQYFDEKELEIMLCGIHEIDVDDWMANTLYRNYNKNSKQVKIFSFILSVIFHTISIMDFDKFFEAFLCILEGWTFW